MLAMSPTNRKSCLFACRNYRASPGLWLIEQCLSSGPVLVGAHLQVFGRLHDIGEIDRVAERVVVQLSPGEGERDVQLAPSASALKLLLVELSRYDSGVTYKVNGAGDAVALIGPQLFAGGATALLGDVDSLAFSEPGEPTEVRILCARDATPA